MKGLTLGQDRDREPFRSMAEIERRIGRGGLTDDEIDRSWECLYPTGDELRERLESIKAHATDRFVYPMVAFVSPTGCRRAEMLRSRIDDIDLDDGIVYVRERKRDTSKEFTMRTVDLHPRPRAVLTDWFAAHPGGQHTSCRGDAGPLTENMATDHLNRTPKAGEKWRIIPGFHTSRHSFASIPASKGVDQRLIDALMGHQTEEMKKRHQHLFPKTLKRAVEVLLTWRTKPLVLVTHQLLMGDGPLGRLAATAVPLHRAEPAVSAPLPDRVGVPIDELRHLFGAVVLLDGPPLDQGRESGLDRRESFVETLQESLRRGVRHGWLFRRAFHHHGHPSQGLIDGMGLSHGTLS